MNKKNYLPTNCPNCGSVLIDGHCEYCGTTVRLVNQLEIDNTGLFSKPTDVILTIRNNKDVAIVPLTGHITNISYNYETAYAEDMMTAYCFDLPMVSFNFEGRLNNELIKEKRNDKNKSN